MGFEVLFLVGFVGICVLIVISGYFARNTEPMPENWREVKSDE